MNKSSGKIGRNFGRLYGLKFLGAFFLLAGGPDADGHPASTAGMPGRAGVSAFT